MAGGVATHRVVLAVAREADGRRRRRPRDGAAPDADAGGHRVRRRVCVDAAAAV